MADTGEGINQRDTTMKHLYAPWRGDYNQSNSQNSEQCPFCIKNKESDDQENFVIKRYKHVFVILNKYPYNAGHCMVIPYHHTGSISDLSLEIRTELMEITTLTTSILEKYLKADGTNIGINSGGKAAGGSIPDHLHMHIVPRFAGDTSFMVTIADTKPITKNLSILYNDLKKAFDAPQ